MAKSESKQSLAGRNIPSVVRGGGTGVESSSEATDSAVGVLSTTADQEDYDTGRASVSSEPEVIVTDVMLELPTVETPLGYVTRRVDTKLNTDQATRLKSIKFGLQARNARLKNGVPVKTDGHVLAWILEQI